MLYYYGLEFEWGGSDNISFACDISWNFTSNKKLCKSPDTCLYSSNNKQNLQVDNIHIKKRSFNINNK